MSGQGWVEAGLRQQEVALERPLGRLAHQGHQLAWVEPEQEAEPGVAAAAVRVVGVVVVAAAAGAVAGQLDAVRAAGAVVVGAAECAVVRLIVADRAARVAARVVEGAAGLAAVGEAIAHVLWAAANRAQAVSYS